MSRINTIMETVIVNYMLYGEDYINFKLLTAVADAVAGDVVRSVRRCRCPFCGRRFRSVGALMKHLKCTSWMGWSVFGRSESLSRFIYPKNPCAYHFSECLKDIISAYWVVRDSLTKEGKRYVLRLNSKELKFRRVESVCKFIRSKKKLIKEVLRCRASTTASSSLPG